MAHGETICLVAMDSNRVECVLVQYAWWLCRNGTSLAGKSVCGEQADNGVQLQSRS